MQATPTDPHTMPAIWMKSTKQSKAKHVQGIAGGEEGWVCGWDIVQAKTPVSFFLLRNRIG